MLQFLQRILTVVLRTTRKPLVIDRRPPMRPDDLRSSSASPLSSEDIDHVIEQWQIEEALELAFLATERVSVARRVVGFFAALTAFIAGVVGTVWVFHNVGLGLALLSAYALPLFVLLVMLGVERTVPLGKN